MPRLARLVVPGQPHHIIHRGANRQVIFRDDQDFAYWLQIFGDAAHAQALKIHAYVLMSNHLHLLLTPPSKESLADAMKVTGVRYTYYFNHRYARTGPLWEGRYRATVIDSERYLLECYRYIDLNPVRAGVCSDPQEYRWSSFHHHISARLDPLVSDHPIFWALGNTPFDRDRAYAALIREGIAESTQRAISDATNKGWALGDGTFSADISNRTGRRANPAIRGRPSIK